MQWQSGDQVLIEMMVFGRPFITLPVTVVWERSDELALWVTDGTRYWHRVQRDGSGVPRVVSASAFGQLDTLLVPSTVRGRTVMMVVRPEQAHAIQLHWDMPGWRFQRWYVNLQTPFVRTSRGVQSTDQFLDIVVDPDLTWRWKDEDELAEAVRVGRLTAAEATAIRAEGERIVMDIVNGRPPFRHTDTLWRPDPKWDVPTAHDDED